MALIGFATLAVMPWRAQSGLQLASTSVPFERRVVSAEGPSARAGILPGDTIDARQYAEQSYLGINNAPASFRIVRNGRSIPVTLIPQRAAFEWGDLVRYLAVLWMVLFALLIVLRGPDTRVTWLLSLALVLQALETAAGQAYWPVPWVAAASLIAAVALWNAVYVVLAVYAWRPFWGVVTCILAVLCDVPDVLRYSTVGAMWFDPQFSFPAWTLVLYAVPIVPLFVCGDLAARAAAGADRQRIAWVFSTFGMFWVIWFLTAVPAAFDITVSPAVRSALSNAGNAALFLVPLGIGYAAVRRRLFDVGFVLNRAAVFAIVSAIIVGCFMLLEWLLGNWFQAASHQTSVLANLALVLVLGFSMRFIHGWVDALVDRTLFRKRHEDAAALERFAGEAPYVTDATMMLQRTVETLERHTDASAVYVALSDGNGRYGDVSENDPAIVSLRAWKKALDLHGLQTKLPGELAFPMVARGRLVGALTLGPKTSGDAYAPDESAAIADVAGSVAAALDLMDSVAHRNQVLERLDALAEMIASLQPVKAPPPPSAQPKGMLQRWWGR
jgi:hypothetical protein